MDGIQPTVRTFLPRSFLSSPLKAQADSPQEAQSTSLFDVMSSDSGLSAGVTDGDSVFPSSSDGTGSARAGLADLAFYGLTQNLRPAAASTVVGRGAGTRATSATTFSMQTLFASLSAGSYVGGGAGQHGLGTLLQSLDGHLDELYKMDPEQATRLGILLETLARLNPKSAQALLERIEAALETYQSTQAQMSAATDLSAATAAASDLSAATAQGAQSGTETIKFSLDFEMTISSDTTVVLSELRDQGFEVHAARVQSTETISVHIEFTGVRQQQTQKSDPLILDLGGDGVALTGIDDGANFDINGDGKTDRTAFVQGNDAFLALDRNGNGRIDDGTELFGDQNGALNGFEELAKYDDNRDGVIDQRDSIFNSLRLLHDKNGDNRVDTNELSTLAEQNVQALSLRYASGWVDDGRGNTLAAQAQYARVAGAGGSVFDAWIGYREQA
jgi:hypothetical protein